MLCSLIDLLLIKMYLLRKELQRDKLLMSSVPRLELKFDRKILQDKLLLHRKEVSLMSRDNNVLLCIKRSHQDRLLHS